jgi:hypothetical protein
MNRMFRCTSLARSATPSATEYPPGRSEIIADLFWRTRIGVRLYVTSLFVHNAAQFALHCFESVVDHFVERLMRAVVHLFFVGYELVAACNSHIDSAPVGITFLVSVIRLLNGDVAAVDVIAKFFQPRCVIKNEIVKLVCFFQTPVRDLNWQLHNY